MMQPGTPLPWQYRDDYTTEGFVTIIGNVDGEYVDGRAECTYDVICRCEDEFGERLPDVAKNVRYIIHAANLLPELLEALDNLTAKADAVMDVRDQSDKHRRFRDALSKARAAIAKARGAA